MLHIFLEQKLQEAVRSWLPQAFPETRASANSNASQALFFFGGADTPAMKPAIGF